MVLILLTSFTQKMRAILPRSRRKIAGGALPNAENWQPFAINLQAGNKGKWEWKPSDKTIHIDSGKMPGIQIQLRKIEFRAPNAGEQLNAAEAKENPTA